jgi:hypothetical protein
MSSVHLLVPVAGESMHTAHGCVLVAVLVILVTALVPGQAGAQTRVARYVSTSGIPHHDVGNCTKSEFWERGDPRGLPDHPTWRPSIDDVLDRIKAEGPNKVFFTGVATRCTGAQANHLVIDRFSDGHLELALKALTGTREDLGAFWAPHASRAPGVLRMDGSASIVGRATVTPNGHLVNRSGVLTEGL